MRNPGPLPDPRPRPPAPAEGTSAVARDTNPADDVDNGPDSEVAAATAATTDAAAADSTADSAAGGAETDVPAANVGPNASLGGLDFDNLFEDEDGLFVPGSGGQASSAARSASAMAVGKPMPDERARQTPSTTARKDPPPLPGKQSKVKGPKIKKGCRVKVKKKHLILAIRADEHKDAHDFVSKFPRGDRNFFGKVIQKEGSGNTGIYLIEFGELPLDSRRFPIARKNIKVLRDNEVEKEFDREHEEMVEECTGKKPSRRNAAKESVQEFLALSPEEQKSAKSYTQKFGPGDEEAVQWTILADNEQIVIDAMGGESANKSPFKVDIPWDPDMNKVDYNEIFFKYFFPSLAGKAKLLDKWLSDPRCPRYETAKNDKIKFDREDDEDPAKLVSTSGIERR